VKFFTAIFPVTEVGSSPGFLQCGETKDANAFFLRSKSFISIAKSRLMTDQLP